MTGSTPFDGADAEQNVFVLQVFLTAFSIPVLLIGAAIEELRFARLKMQELAGSLSGGEGPAAGKVRAFARELAARIRSLSTGRA